VDRRILHVWHNTLGVFSLNVYMYSLSVFSVHIKILLAFSETNFFDSFPVFFLMHICIGKLDKRKLLIKKKKKRVPSCSQQNLVNKLKKVCVYCIIFFSLNNILIHLSTTVHKLLKIHINTCAGV
jgi:hypothetical protein